MATLRAILRELAGLFVDDGSLALGAVIWLGICAFLFHGMFWGGVGFFIGLAALLAASTLRAGRRRQKG